MRKMNRENTSKGNKNKFMIIKLQKKPTRGLDTTVRTYPYAKVSGPSKVDPLSTMKVTEEWFLHVSTFVN